MNSDKSIQSDTNRFIQPTSISNDKIQTTKNAPLGAVKSVHIQAITSRAQSNISSTPRGLRGLVRASSGDSVSLQTIEHAGLRQLSHLLSYFKSQNPQTEMMSHGASSANKASEIQQNQTHGIAEGRNPIAAEVLPPQPRITSLFKSALESLQKSIKQFSSYLSQQSHLDRIAMEGAPITSRTATGNEVFKSFNIKSNIPIDMVTTTDGETKLYMTLNADERLELDKQKFAQIQEFLENIPENLTAEHRQECIAEVLSKVLAYISPAALEKTLNIPDAEGNRVEYQLKRKELANSNLPFFVLTPPADKDDAKAAKAWLIIRGTDANIVGKSVTDEERASALKSVVADFAKSEGLSTAPIDNSFDEIKEFLDDNPGCQLAGHSLGGVIQHLGVKAATKGCTIGTIFAFNSPGVSAETRTMYNDLDANAKPHIKCFDKRGDFIPSAGRYLIGDHYRVKQGNSRSDVAHREIDSNKTSTLQLIDNEREETKATRRLSEGLRSTLGPAIVGTATRIAGLITGKNYLQEF